MNGEPVLPRVPDPPLSLEALAARLDALEELFRHHHHAEHPHGDPRDELRHQVALQMTGQLEENASRGDE